MKNISFSQLMYAYAAESSYGSKMKVYMPDLFPDKKQGSAIDYKINNGSAKNTIINKNTPPISNMIDARNYLELPVMGNVSASLNDKLVVAFINSNPRNGIILGKA